MEGPKKIMSPAEAIQRLMDLCSRSEKSTSEVRQKLSDWKLENEAEAIIGELCREKFIDDSRYAAAFAVDKMRFNKWGILKIKYLLKSRQIAESDIENAIRSIDTEKYNKMVFAELKKKKATLKKMDPFKSKSKLYAFGNQRGYENNLINDFIESSNLS
jgi:regulatory protein